MFARFFAPPFFNAPTRGGVFFFKMNFTPSKKFGFDPFIPPALLGIYSGVPEAPWFPL